MNATYSSPSSSYYKAQYMTKKAALIKRNVLRNIFGVFSFTTALFVFQACYGTPADYGECGCHIEGIVKTANSDLPINAVNINVNGDYLARTDSLGRFWICMENSEYYNLELVDGDRERNGLFISKDTVLTSVDWNDYFYLELVLNEK